MNYTPHRLEESFAQLEEALRAYEKYVHAEEVLSEKKKTFLAALKHELRGDTKASDAALETEAKASPKWAQFLETWKKDLVQAGLLWARVEIAKHRWETNRSLNSVWKAGG